MTAWSGRRTRFPFVIFQNPQRKNADIDSMADTPLHRVRTWWVSGWVGETSMETVLKKSPLIV